LPEDLKERGSKRCMTRRVGWKGWCEVRAEQVARWGTERREVHVADGQEVAVACAGGTGPGVGLADAGDRTPELIIVLRLPTRDRGIRHCDVNQREHPCELDDVRPPLPSELRRNLVVEPRRRTEPRRSVVAPVDPRHGLVRNACRRRGVAV